MRVENQHLSQKEYVLCQILDFSISRNLWDYYVFVITKDNYVFVITKFEKINLIVKIYV